MGSEYYEDQKILSEYLFFHYGDPVDYFPFKFGPRDSCGFPWRIVEIGIQGLSIPQNARALDIGCAVGGSAFELSHLFQEVMAFDFSESFIKAAQKIQRERSLSIEVTDEVGKSKQAQISLPRNAFPERVKFFQADAMKMDPQWGQFDFVLASNLIDRLPDPRQFLKQVSAFVKSQGILILASPYTWMESFTSRENWLNQGQGNFDALNDLLKKDFELCRKEDVSMLIREHYRKYQWTVSELTVWRKN